MHAFDGQTDRILIARPRLHSMQRGKNEKYYVCLQCYRFILQVSFSFFKSLFSTHSPQPLLKNSLITFLLHNLQKRASFHQNSIFAAETRVHAKPLTPNRHLLPSNAYLVSEY